MNQTKDAVPVNRPAPIGPETAEASWFKTEDGVEHFLRVWGPQKNHAAVIYLHGIEGHSRWFETTALALCQSGFSVWALDRRGAGMSKERRGHLNNYRCLLADTEQLLSKAQSQGNSELFLMGNCWGAKAAIAVAASRQSGISPLSGLILTSPAISVRVDVSLRTKLQIAISCILGGRRTFPIPLEPAHFTDNPGYLDFIKDDPLRLTAASAAFFIESLKLTALARRKSPELSVPTLVLQSGADAIVDVAAIKRWFETVGSDDKTLTVFEDACHSLDFDSQADSYILALVQWLSAHCHFQGRTSS